MEHFLLGLGSGLVVALAVYVYHASIKKAIQTESADLKNQITTLENKVKDAKTAEVKTEVKAAVDQKLNEVKTEVTADVNAEVAQVNVEAKTIETEVNKA